MKNNSKSEYPRILVISNNSFSVTSNNGKTLASFFKAFPSEKIAQLYFNPELPTDINYNNYFRITDSEVVKSFISKNKPGRIIEGSDTVPKITKANYKKNAISRIKRYNLFRIGRELFWMNEKWKTDSLNQWLIDFSPEIIFLCAGDTGFAYDINEYIKKKFNTKLVVYITDDYILPRKTISPFWWLRRNYIYNKMKKAVQQSDLFITISQEMKKNYKELFGVDSILAMNMTESMKGKDDLMEMKEMITLVYAGGLHFKRYKTLNLLAKAIQRYNSDLKMKKVFLEVYSGSEPDENIKRYLDIEDTSKYCGSLNQDELKIVLNQCDIPVHVESFDSKCIESTRLSISTKIPEYLSLGKPVLAIGPNEVASMKYLKDSAFCITDSDNIYVELKNLLNDSELKDIYSNKALAKFEMNHKKEFVSKMLMDKIVSINKQK